MVIVVMNTRDGLKVEKVSQHDWDTMKTALYWKERGIWNDVKNFVHNMDRRKPEKKKRFWR